MRKMLLTMGLVLTAWMVQAQVVTSKHVSLSFFSEAPLEDIYAESKEGMSALDLGRKTIYFKVSIRTFGFEKGLMQEHFNENYLESDKFPFAEFKGKIEDAVDLSVSGVHQVAVRGELTIHNVTKVYSVKAEFKNEAGRLTGNASFPVSLKDHQIKIPRLVIKNIAEVVQVTVSANYGKLHQQDEKNTSAKADSIKSEDK